MGSKRPSIRTLESGERVLHHPPDDAHPEGMMVLIPGPSALRDRHDARLHHHRQAHAELKVVHADRIDYKNAVQRRSGVPSEKRCV